ncbi:hypothetical protein CRM22_009395 [Opisthorchis felineus]|uniref:F5/8 type C domain-containing protein n=1 Tax=Opisthorchis felineus TaxID=147828 RepID=A0A4S2L7S4_OPIFE|nr:hypothetical protein CRM22_009395 [Opisthorchis felineus]
MVLEIDRTTVSSVLNRDIKQFGKAHLFDGNPETCWSSDSGSPQWIHISLKSPECINAIRIQFQGGFSGLDTTLEAWNDNEFVGRGKDAKATVELFPKDTNVLQTLPVSLSEPFLHYRIVFHSTTDFYGRVIVYQLSLQQS